MKKPISPVAVVCLIVVALGVVGYLFVKGTAGPAQQAQNLPDYSKMSPTDISKSREQSNAAEAEAMANRPR
jgi:predicted PurR-regulated permease PerM